MRAAAHACALRLYRAARRRAESGSGTGAGGDGEGRRRQAEREKGRRGGGVDAESREGERERVEVGSRKGESGGERGGSAVRGCGRAFSQRCIAGMFVKLKFSRRTYMNNIRT